jgi:hypothetical protein
MLDLNWTIGWIQHLAVGEAAWLCHWVHPALAPSLVMVVLIMVLVDEHKDVLVVVLHAAACWWVSSEKCFRCFCNLNTFLQLADREGATLRGVGGRRLAPSRACAALCSA